MREWVAVQELHPVGPQFTTFGSAGQSHLVWKRG